LQRYRHGQWDLLREFADDLGWRGDRALLCGEGGEGLQELRVAVVLAGAGLRQSLPASGDVGGELCAIAAIGAPRGEQRQNEATCNGHCSDTD
jgi:hypothetical protein